MLEVVMMVMVTVIMVMLMLTVMVNGGGDSSNNAAMLSFALAILVSFGTPQRYEMLVVLLLDP